MAFARLSIIGAGATGRVLAAMWQAEGHDVNACTVSPEDADALRAMEVPVVLARGSDRDAMRALLEDRDGVVVLVAGGYAEAMAGDLSVFTDAVTGTAQNLASLLSEEANMPPRIVYGSSTNAPGSAGGWARATEDCPATPARPMDQLVIDAEQTILALNGRGIKASVLRIGHIYDLDARDPRASARMMPGRTVPYPADSAVSLVHVEDVARACGWALRHELQGIYNLVDDTPGSRSSFYDGLMDQLGVGPHPAWGPPGGLPQAFPNDKLKATGFTFRYPTFADAVAAAGASVPAGRHG